MTKDGGVTADRLEILWLAARAVAVLLALRLAWLQIVYREEYRQLAERNRTQKIFLTAPRGVIYDRKGALLAGNRGAFSLVYIPSRDQKNSDLTFLARQLARELKREPDDLLDTLQQAAREETTLHLAENLPQPAFFRLSELKTIYHGLEAIVEARRDYPRGRFASHLLGYMGKIDSNSWKTLKSKGYRVDSRVGKIGLEAVFDKELRGRDGSVVMEVDALGRQRHELERIPAEPGSDMHLAIDAEMQKAADEGLRNSTSGKGAVVAIDPRDGSIRALSSAPDFDPNAFLSPDPEEVKGTFKGLDEFNRAISGTYAPGSTFKVVLGAAGLNEGRFTVSDSVYCPGYLEWGKDIFLCWEHKGHKRMTWYPGLAHSCDVYFYRMGLKTGGDLIERYARMFGLGARTNVAALRGERKGNVFGPSVRAKAGRAWYDGDTINLSIGQGEMLVTPIQMAALAAAVANRGTLWRPRLIDRIVYADGTPEYRQNPEKLGSVPLKDEVWQELQDAMRLVVSSGTGVAARIAGLDVAGKTGTAQNPAGADHAWFIAFASRSGEPAEAAVAVLVENGGHGASAAGPIARAVMMAAYGLQDKKPETKPGPVTAGGLPARLPAPLAAPAGRVR